MPGEIFHILMWYQQFSYATKSTSGHYYFNRNDSKDCAKYATFCFHHLDF